MPLVTLAKARRPRQPTNSRGRRPSKARDASLRRQMERTFTASYDAGIRRIKAGVSTQKMADAYYSQDYAGVMIAVPFEDFNVELAGAIRELAQATANGGTRAARSVPDLKALRYDLDNPRIKAYLQERTSAMVNYVHDEFGRTVTGMLTGRYGKEVRAGDVADEFQTASQKLISSRFSQGVSTKDLTWDIGQQLRATIGLDWVSAGALANANASGKFSKKDLAAYEDRLLDRRAARIARTEIAYANNYGQIAVWSEAQEQGLIPENARKVWIADADPCEKICLPMDGLSVPLDEDFLCPNGVTVPSPPSHVNCRCLLQISQEGDDDAPGSNAQNYKDD